MAVLDLANLAGSLLDEAAAVLDAAASPSVPGAPARQVFVVGRPAFEACDQLAVSVNPNVRVAVTGDQAELLVGRACHNLTLAGLRLWLTACVPVSIRDGSAPKPEAINAASTRLYGQGWALWCGLRNRLHDGTLLAAFYGGLTPPMRQATVIVQALTPIDAQGGVAGWTIDVLAQLDVDPAL